MNKGDLLGGNSLLRYLHTEEYGYGGLWLQRTLATEDYSYRGLWLLMAGGCEALLIFVIA